MNLAAVDIGVIDAQIGENGFVLVFLLVEANRHLVDDLEITTLADAGLDFLCLVGPHIVL